MLEAMVDIETLGTTPNSVILEVGIVLFDGELRRSGLKIRPSIHEQVERGRSIDDRTVAWWTEQDPDVMRDVFCGKRDSALIAATAIVDNLGVGSIGAIWSKGPQFDMVIIESFLASFGVKPSWHYAKLMDLRTVQRMVPQNAIGCPVITTGEHDSINDCEHQIDVLLWARAALGLDSAKQDVTSQKAV